MTARTETITKLGNFLLRYGLLIVLGWIGAMKFTHYEAEGNPWLPSVP